MRMRLLTDGSRCATLAALHARCFRETWSAESMAQLLAQPGTFGCLSEDESGFILVRVAGDESEVLTLAVDPAARRRGTATNLIVTASEHAAAMGAGRLFLEVGNSNLAAISLYKGLGFVVVGRRKDYYKTSTGGGEDALVLNVEIPLFRVGNCD